MEVLSKIEVTFDHEVVNKALQNIDQAVELISDGRRLGVMKVGLPVPKEYVHLARLPAMPASSLGCSIFKNKYQTAFAYKTGAMANAIASAELVIAMGKRGLLASYGAGGVNAEQVEQDVLTIKSALGHQPFAVNLIHAPHEQLLEQKCVDICLKHQVRIIEASAFMNMTASILHYRLAGVHLNEQGQVVSDNSVVAKVSRPEVALQFMEPAPDNLVKKLLAEGKISSEQAMLAPYLPVADDITVEADSGGHTDRRPLISLLPVIQRLKAKVEKEHNYAARIRIGAAGGIGTPEAALAAFSLGADYIVTGSINQSCQESGSSDIVREALAQAEISDVEMAPAADMFEMGVQLQVLKRGTLFPMRSKKLYKIYQSYDSLDAIPPEVKMQLEQQIFKKSLEAVWEETCTFFAKRDPAQVERAAADPKRKMALVFRSYLGLSSFWANQGLVERKLDYQIWTGPSMGAFNDWVKGSYLEVAKNRNVADVAQHIMRGCAFLQRLQWLKSLGVEVPHHFQQYQIVES